MKTLFSRSVSFGHCILVRKKTGWFGINSKSYVQSRV